MNEQAIKELLYTLADNQLVLGHRNSEWTGIGPILEEDIAFSSMAQDKLGHSLAFYALLYELGESDPDTLAFMRNPSQFHCCQLVELPIGEYDFSLIRHFLYDHAEAIRFEYLTQAGYEPLAKVATKLRGELKYHLLHANTMVKQLGNATAESINRLQQSLNDAFPYALGMFESSPYEAELASAGIFPLESQIQTQWLENIRKVLAQTQLQLPDLESVMPVFGGRRGVHSEYLQPLLDEMAEVYNLDPNTEW
ncbi:phenylacetate-CoA oxygenase subunit PaaI [Adhaeribacter aerolatus]|uniref:Phenylacetate-CoA oxygenase subunit PaaI n=1 Tax=Adhaeribacter aerolatus TaxID=670289 RepID=A0A512AU83_9BACT|nr:1,2-phenylacetyl-CoA epoxidase subunit PaaC [Adhaeribacter aerolatus]GEO03272.1 phenylacetate-CoA oxygenase subunit PaaI [Adhaeribacter aerolatus]